MFVCANIGFDQKVYQLRDQNSASLRFKIITTIISREALCFFYLLFCLTKQNNRLLSNVKIAQLAITIFFTMIPTVIFFQIRTDSNSRNYNTGKFDETVDESIIEISDMVRSSSIKELKKRYVLDIKNNTSLNKVKEKMHSLIDEYLTFSMNKQAEIEMDILVEYIQKLISKYWMFPGSSISSVQNLISKVKNNKITSNSTWISFQNNLVAFSNKMIGMYEINLLLDQIDSIAGGLGTDYSKIVQSINQIKGDIPTINRETIPFFTDQNTISQFLSAFQDRTIDAYYMNPIASQSQSSQMASDFLSCYKDQLSEEYKVANQIFIQRAFFDFDIVKKRSHDFLNQNLQLCDLTENSSEISIARNLNILFDQIDNILNTTKNTSIKNEIQGVKDSYSKRLAEFNGLTGQKASGTSVQYPALSLISDEDSLSKCILDIAKNMVSSEGYVSTSSQANNNLLTSLNVSRANMNSIQSLWNTLSTIQFPSVDISNYKNIIRQITKNMYTSLLYKGPLFSTNKISDITYNGLRRTVDADTEVYIKTTEKFSNPSKLLYGLQNNSFDNVYLFSPILFKNDIVDENFNSLTSNPIDTPISQNLFNISSYADGFLMERTIDIGYDTSLSIRAVKGTNPKIFLYTKKYGTDINNLYFFNPDIIFSTPGTTYTHFDPLSYLQTNKTSSGTTTSKLLKTNFQISASDLVDVPSVKWPIQQIKFYSFPYNQKANRTIVIDNQIHCPAALDSYNLVLIIYFSDRTSALSIVANQGNCQYNFWKLSGGVWITN
jgi:hypothetical protein